MSLKSQCEGGEEKCVECICDVNGKGTNTTTNEEKESDDVSSIDSVRSVDDVSQLLLTLSARHDALRHDALREEERLLQAAIVAAEGEIETMEAQKEELRRKVFVE